MKARPTTANVSGSVGVVCTGSCAGRARTRRAATMPITRPMPTSVSPWPKHHAQHVLLRRAERHAQAELLRALRHRLRDDAGDAGQRDEQRQRREHREQHRRQLRRGEVRIADLVERADVLDRQVGIDAVHGVADDRGRRRGIAGHANQHAPGQPAGLAQSADRSARPRRGRGQTSSRRRQRRRRSAQVLRRCRTRSPSPIGSRPSHCRIIDSLMSDHRRRVLVIELGEQPAALDRDAQRVEVLRARDTHVRGRPLVGRRCRSCPGSGTASAAAAVRRAVRRW